MINSDVKEKLSEYKYLMNLNSVEPSIRKQDTEIISSLRYGVAPDKGVLKFSVGREEILHLIKQDLRYVQNGKSKLRFFNGCYGSGKTHTLYLLRELAFKNNFASSFITLTTRECPMSDLGTVYSHIVKSLRTDSCRDIPALEMVIQNWCDKILTIGLDNRKLVLQKLKKLSPDFQNVLTIYVESPKKEPWRIKELAIRWIQGDLNNFRDAKTVGASSYACDVTALEMLQNLVSMLKVLGFNGMVIFLDEAESIPCISKFSKIRNAYDNLGRLINCNFETTNLYFIYATTPLFFKEVEIDRFPDIKDENIINLQPLPKSSLQQLAIHIRDLHIQSYDWTNISRLIRQNLLNYVDMFLRTSKDGTLARNFVKAIVTSLDICQENPKLALVGTLKSIKL